MNIFRMANFFRHIAAFLMAAALLLLVGSIAEACPSCKAALENNSAGGNLIQGYFWSIMFMMAAPFAILGGFSGYMYSAVRKARRQREAEAADSGQALDGQALDN